MATTVAPRAWAPRANAAANSGEESRMSCPTTTSVPAAPTSSTNPAASAATMSVVSVWPTRPRTSYALTMVFRWAMASSVRLGLMPKTYLTEHVAHHPVAHNLPALRRRGACCVPLAQVVGMRFTGRGQGAEHGHRIGVDEGECGHSGVGAGDSGARPD